MNIPVVGGGLQQVLDAVARGLLFAAGQQHVDAIEVGLDRAGIELERLVEGAAGFEHVHLAAQPVARVLEMRDAQAGPGGRILIVLLEHDLK